MTTMITDPGLEARLLAERRMAGSDRFDEVWDGVYMMNPLPNEEHQQIASQLASILTSVIAWQDRGNVYAGVNVSDRESGWEHNYRAPDVAVYLRGTAAKNCGTHWKGGPDLAVEITSPGDRTREKIAFYGQIGTRELLIVERSNWSLELWRLVEGQLVLTAKTHTGDAAGLALSAAPVEVRFVAVDDSEAPPTRPRIEARHVESNRVWVI